jgi:hypothetical protein
LAGILSKQQLIERLIETRGCHPQVSCYGESNQKLSFMVNALRDAFPNAVYIWLIRNGLDVVASTYHRKWYIPGESHMGEWSTYRIQGDAVGDMPMEKWSRMNVFEKNCWYWAWTNRKIFCDLKNSGAPWLLVRIEELHSKLPEVCAFLGVKAFKTPGVPVLNSAKGLKGKTTKINYWDSWQRKIFNRWCGDLMDTIYPDWRCSLKVNAWESMRNELLRPLSHRHTLGRFFGAALRSLPNNMHQAIRVFSEGRRN